MSAPIVWIIMPVAVAGISFFLRRWKRIITVTLTVYSVILVFLAGFVSIGELHTIGSWTFTLSNRFVFAGRQFVLNNSDRPMLVIIYLTVAFFFVGSISARVSQLFVPLGLAIAATMVASLTVRPFLYAALFIQVAVLLGVPLLSPPGNAVPRGVLRYLMFLSFGLPFLLLAGWLISGVGNDVTDPADLLPALVFLGIGFVFLLAIFPLNTWIPMLMESVHPYSTSYLLTILPVIVISLLLRFMGRYTWLLDLDVIPLLGLLMVVTGGLWAAFQQNLGRLLGYAVIIEIGRSLLVISQPAGEFTYIAMLFPRLLTLGVWALSLSIIRSQAGDLRFKTAQGMGRKVPLVALGVLVANFSLAGFPLAANFPVLYEHWNQLAQDSLSFAFWSLMGSVGLMVGGLRTMTILVREPGELAWDGKIDWASKIFLILGVIIIFLAGLFPQWFVFGLAEVMLLF